ncbi:hypothetical protein [Celeribacter indicus]|uniref:Cell division and transport-associated protein TolA n=1 Tax=Celeribacter indicus TaxID=1208324 RepID=A0A0B5DS91_9RHOB|nr:hypothetical protein [Celeribacter indicus]AJE45909.1 hypothetical protein P73_1194 [Celeribacter indicus]SDW63510.1 Cell division and transport-associated protein TolA [Celeribacter indicus]
MNAGQYISGAGHLVLIAYVLFGGMFLTPEETQDVAVQEVDLISEAEFAALAERSTAPETYEEAPVLRAPPSDTAPQIRPVQEETPAPAAPQPPAETPPEPQPEVSEELTPPVEVDPTPPAPQTEPELSLEDPGAGVPDRPDSRPTPKPVPRISDQVVTAPEPQPQVADAPSEAPSEEAETEEIVEEVQEEAGPQETTTEIVTEAETPSGMSTSPRPKSRPANLAQRMAEAERAEAPAQPQQPAASETPRETPREDTSDAVADAAAAAAAALAAESAETPAAPSRPVGPPLTAGEREGLRVAVSQCWNVGAMSSDALRTTITVAVSMNEDGTPQQGSIRLLNHQGGTEAGAQSAFEVARRAIIRCGARGFPLPVDKFDHWRNIEMTFDPEQMRYK